MEIVLIFSFAGGWPQATHIILIILFHKFLVIMYERELEKSCENLWFHRTEPSIYAINESQLASQIDGRPM